MRRAWIALAFLLVFAPQFLAQEKPRVLVSTFENPSNASRSTIGNALTDIFRTELDKKGRVRIFVPSPGGQTPTVDFLIEAKVTNFSYKETAVSADRIDVPEGQRRAARVYEQQIDVRIDFSILNASTRESVFSETATRTEKNFSAEARMADYNRLVAERVSVSTQEVLGSIMGRTTIGAIEDAVSKITGYFGTSGGITRELVGKVLAVIDPRHFIVNLGSNQGLKPNDVLNVYREVLVAGFKERQLKGSLEVVESQPDRAKVKLVSGSGILKDDAVIREAPKATAEEHIKKGRDFFEQKFYSKALDEFNQAKELSPNSAEMLQYLGMTNLFLKNWREASSSFQQALEIAGQLELAVYHHHVWRQGCSGSLIIGKGFLQYKPSGGDHGFRVDLDQIEKAGISRYKEAEDLEVKWPDKTYSFQCRFPGLSGTFNRSSNLYIYGDDQAEIHNQALTIIQSVLQRRLN
ncbi:MAG: hypothetical protein ABIN58_01275 [candidate division WOR-3 bacterium]